MLQAFDRPGAAGALLNAFAAVALAAAANGLIAALGLGGGEGVREPSFAPPGAVVGGVWVVLFALMGLARWAAVQARDRGGGAWVVGLIGLCAAYPFYTGGFDLLPSMIGAVVTLVAAVAVALRLLRRAPRAALLVAPVVTWVAFACVLTGVTIVIN